MGDLNPEIDYKGEVVATGDTDPPTLFFNKNSAFFNTYLM